MPTIKLTDQLGASVDAEINPDSTIAKYVKDLSKLKFPKLNFEELKNGERISFSNPDSGELEG